MTERRFGSTIMTIISKETFTSIDPFAYMFSTLYLHCVYLQPRQAKFLRIVDNGLMINAVALVRQSSRYLSIRVVTYGLVTGDAIKTLDLKSRVEDEKH